MIDTGRMRHRVTLEAEVTAPNPFGEQVPSWQAEAVVWASVEPLSGREVLQADQLQSQVTHRVWIRWRQGVEANKRFRHRGRALNILSVHDRDERRELLECLCVEQSL